LQQAINEGLFGKDCVVPVDCAGYWNYNYGSCSATACGTSGRYDKQWVTTVSPMGTGAACPSPTFVNNGGNSCSAAACPINCAGYWNYRYGSCSVTACGSSGRYDRLWTTTRSAAHGGAACPSPTFVNNGGYSCSTAACCVDSLWTPGTGTVCSGLGFTQTSNCGTTKWVAGTKNCADTYGGIAIYAYHGCVDVPDSCNGNTWSWYTCAAADNRACTDSKESGWVSDGDWHCYYRYITCRG